MTQVVSGVCSIETKKVRKLRNFCKLLFVLLTFMKLTVQLPVANLALLAVVPVVNLGLMK